jgi:hypothetical protein
MIGGRLTEMTVEELVVRFTAVALDQDEALRRDEIPKFNRLYDRLEDVIGELRARAGDRRGALLSLHSHRNAQVRLKAAIATLATAPRSARRVLQLISDGHEYPQAAFARDMLSALDDGTYVPN